MTTRNSRRAGFWVPLVVLVLAVALALGGCGRAAHMGSSATYPSSQQAGGSGQSATNDELQQLQQLEQQTQQDLDGLNNDQTTANQNIGSDQEIQP